MVRLRIRYFTNTRDAIVCEALFSSIIKAFRFKVENLKVVVDIDGKDSFLKGCQKVKLGPFKQASQFVTKMLKYN